jgi:hypothetical protein
MHSAVQESQSGNIGVGRGGLTMTIKDVEGVDGHDGGFGVGQGGMPAIGVAGMVDRGIMS